MQGRDQVLFRGHSSVAGQGDEGDRARWQVHERGATAAAAAATAATATAATAGAVMVLLTTSLVLVGI